MHQGCVHLKTAPLGATTHSKVNDQKDFLLPNLANKQKVNMSVRSVSADMLTSLVKYPKKAKKKCREDLGTSILFSK